MGQFTEGQHDLISYTLMVLFGATGDHSAAYISKVLFPEVLIKLYMDAKGFEYTKAEEELFVVDLAKVSYMC
jgi:hypothetical protein